MTADSFFRVCAARIRTGPAGIAWVKDIREKALAKISQGGGLISVLTSATGAGKTFERDVRLDAVEVADLCDTALADADPANGSETIATTSMDFSRL